MPPATPARRHFFHNAVHRDGRQFERAKINLQVPPADEIHLGTQRPLPSRTSGAYPEDNSPSEESAPQRSFE
jgi:hypothetical protein